MVALLLATQLFASGRAEYYDTAPSRSEWPAGPYASDPRLPEGTVEAAFSIIVSAGCIAFSSSTISMDKDTDPNKRLIAPNFYGYFPDKNRMMVFILMNMMTTGHVLMKVLACSLMLRLSAIWFWIYLSVDTGLYLLYKLVRGDLRYWLTLRGAISWIATFITRIVSKIIVDFTLLVHFRHSFELGGIYWSLNVCSNQVFCFISVLLYSEYSDASEDVVDFLWRLVGGLFFFSMLNFSLFLCFINKEYRGTFFSKTSGKEFLCELWRDAATDKEKFYIFGKHKSYYFSINEDVKRWLDENWERWEEERPEWFTAKLISKVPADLLPESALASMGGVKGRRKSIDAMKKEEEEEKLKGKRKQSVRGADLKIIPNVVGEEEGL